MFSHEALHEIEQLMSLDPAELFSDIDKTRADKLKAKIQALLDTDVCEVKKRNTLLEEKQDKTPDLEVTADKLLKYFGALYPDKGLGSNDGLSEDELRFKAKAALELGRLFHLLGQKEKDGERSLKLCQIAHFYFHIYHITIPFNDYTNAKEKLFDIPYEEALLSKAIGELYAVIKKDDLHAFLNMQSAHHALSMLSYPTKGLSYSEAIIWKGKRAEVESIQSNLLSAIIKLKPPHNMLKDWLSSWNKIDTQGGNRVLMGQGAAAEVSEAPRMGMKLG